MQAAKVQSSLRIHAVLPEPPLLIHTSSESRGTFRQKARALAPLNGFACAVKICHDGMLKDTNLLDAALIILGYLYHPVIKPKGPDIFSRRWLGRAMMLGSFQCRGVLLLWHMVGQGPAVLAAGAEWVSCFFCAFSSHLSYLPFSNASSLGRLRDILKYCSLSRYNPTVVVSYYRRRAH